MPTALEFAILSDRTYQDVRSNQNRPALPETWVEISYASANKPGVLGHLASAGFSAGVYQRGRDIVIAYAGTNPDAASPDGILDWANNIVTGTGLLVAPQVVDAALIYQHVKRQFPEREGYSIYFTGHSLGA